MLEAHGNLWNTKAEVVFVTTNGTIKHNGEAVMGRGCAREAAQRWPWVPRRLGDYLKTYGNRPFILHNAGINGEEWPYMLGSMPVKHNWWEEADIELIKESAALMMAMADKHGWKSIAMPRPGCGNGKLQWRGHVQDELSVILDDRFTAITFPPR